MDKTPQEGAIPAEIPHITPEMTPEDVCSVVRTAAEPLRQDMRELSTYLSQRTGGNKPYGRIVYDRDHQENPELKPFEEFVEDGIRQRAEEQTWYKFIDQANDETEQGQLINGFGQWLQSTQPNRYYGSAAINSASLYRTVGNWMTERGLPFDSDGPIVGSLRESVVYSEANPWQARYLQSAIIISSKELPLNKRTQKYKDGLSQQLLTKAVVWNGPNRNVAHNPLRERLAEITGKPVVKYDIDGNGVDDLRTLMDDLFESKKPGGKFVSRLDTDTMVMVRDTFALLTACGSANAEKLFAQMQLDRSVKSDTEVARTLPVSKVIELANIITGSINRSGLLTNDQGDQVLLDNLVRGQFAHLPEAFRRLLYASIDLDSGLHDNVDTILETLRINDRVEIIADYIEARELINAGRSREVGQVALKDVRSQAIRTQSGKKPMRAALYKPGHGQIS